MLIFDRFPSLERAQAFAQAVRFAEPDLDVKVYETGTDAQREAIFPWQLDAPCVLVERCDQGDDDAILRVRELGGDTELRTGAEREAGLEALVTTFGGTFAGT